MSSFALPPEAVPPEIPRTAHLQIVSPAAELPDDDGWLHEIEDRNTLLRDLVGAALLGCPRIVCVDHMRGNGAALFAAVRQLGAEGIAIYFEATVAGSSLHFPHCGGDSQIVDRSWLR